MAKQAFSWSIVIGFLICSLQPAVAGGSKDTIDTPARKLDSWLEKVDISERKPGKYNILITGKDLAGNEGFAGPFNMYVDPNSDLPVTRITNPLQDMRVPGNLNIVGTCIDDDAVDYVELILDGAETPIRAKGKEYWSFYLNTNGLAEGAHVISVYGVDVNGVRGEPFTISWNLDRNRPETEVRNRALGSLVSGKFSLAGRITDGNGVKSLLYSLDNGASFEPVKLDFNKGEFAWAFNLEISTEGMKDGPAVCWFKAVDGQGSEGLYTFLYYIDNTKPTVAFITPEEGEAVDGLFTIAGVADDVNGIASVDWRAGKEGGSFELVKGNPYWIREFDARAAGGKSFDVTVTAKDNAGNAVSVTRKIPIDASRDVPLISLSSPASGSVVQGDLRISGVASDDDAIAAIWYAIDGGDPVEIATQGAFGVSVPGLSPGTHLAQVIPVDAHGTRGVPVSASFTIAGPPPSVSIPSLGADPAGMSVESGASIAARVDAPAGLKSLSYRITGLAEVAVPVKSGAATFDLSIPISPSFPYGLLTLEVVATDVHDRVARGVRSFYATNLSIERGKKPEIADDSIRASAEVLVPAGGKAPPVPGQASLYFERLLPDDMAFANGMRVELAGPGAPKSAQAQKSVRVALESPLPATEVLWSLNGGTPQRASARKVSENRYEIQIPLSPLLAADWLVLDVAATLKDGTVLRTSGLVSALRPQPAAGVYDDESFSWDAVPADSGAFVLAEGGVLEGLYNGRPGRFAAQARIEKGPDGLEVSLDGNRVRVTARKEGEYPGLKLTVVDSSGAKYATAPFSVVVDSGSPELAVDASARPAWVQGSVPVKGQAKDGNAVASVEFSLDGGASWRAFNNKEKKQAGKRSFSFDESIDVSAIPDGKVELLVRATDSVGRATYDWRVFTKDTAAPEVETVVPAPGDVVNGETLIAFRTKDTGPIALAEYRASGDKSSWLPVQTSSLTNAMVGTAERPISDKMRFRFTDAAGNATVIDSWFFKVDAQADLPVVEIHLPSENEVVRKDFALSGVVYDDDQAAKLWYRVDAGPAIEVPIENSYSVPVSIKALGDNEHSIALWGEDIHGVRGKEVVRKVRVSLEEPKGEVVSPSFEQTSKGVVELTGTASDKNGIEKVEVSLDNGNSFNLAEGTERWKYRFDSRVIQDGTHVVFFRVYDKYGTTGLYSSQINLDNTPPAIRLELPLDGSRTGETLFIAGQTLDNIGLDRVSAKISNIDPKQPAIPGALTDIPFDNELIISRGVLISILPEGFYNLEVRGYDKAGNITRVSRNFEVYKGKDRNRIEFLYPMSGESVQGVFNVYGRVVSEDPPMRLMLYVDGKESSVSDPTPSGYFKFTLTPETLTGGAHTLAVRALLAGDKVVTSEDRQVIYKPNGPWVTIDSLAMGDFAIDRPWLMGSAGYAFTEEEILTLKSKDTTKAQRRTMQDKSLKEVEISFDNGKTFLPTESGKKWRFRIETTELPEGYHFMIVRATMVNGEVAVTRTIVQIDKTPPVIKLISPGEGGRYNDELVFSGLSSDDVKLYSVMLSLRPGDKSSYAVPAFIQGLYFDWHFWGATLYDIGVGLTFFDQNVKVQAQFGQFTAEQRKIFTPANMRYGGNVFGLKMLANLAYVPADYFFGPDFMWLSATAAIGANFSVFTESQSGKPQILSALLIQLEFPRVTIPKRKTFKTFSLYTEGQFWFIPTDVDSGEVNIQSILPHITGGIRINVF